MNDLESFVGKSRVRGANEQNVGSNCYIRKRLRTGIDPDKTCPIILWSLERTVDGHSAIFDINESLITLS